MKQRTRTGLIIIWTILFCFGVYKCNSQPYINFSMDANKSFHLKDNSRTVNDIHGLDYDVELGVKEDFGGIYMFYGEFSKAGFRNYGVGFDYYVDWFRWIDLSAGAAYSMVFEKDFREYISKFITPDINYFSFLRPLNEYGIARLFSGFPEYLPVFKSCNIGSKTDSWCCKCPKCLFVFIILSPFIDKDELVKVFGKDIFQDPDLLKYFDELTGVSIVKPFECVGTID